MLPALSRFSGLRAISRASAPPDYSIKTSQRLFALNQRSFLSSLVYIEHKDSKIDPSTLNTLVAAKQIGGPISALVAGSNAQEVAQAVSKIDGVEKVIVANNPIFDHNLAEAITPLLLAVQKAENPTHVLASHNSVGKRILPRFAALIDSQQISDIIKVVDETTFVRPIYAGNALETVQSSDSVKIITVRSSSFPQAEAGSSSAAVSEAPTPEVSVKSKWIGEEVTKGDRPELGSAKIVVSGGRAVKSKEGFDLIQKLADKMGAAVGASRAAVDAGYCDNSLQVGQTGKIVAPQLYIAIGISGAIQHLAGMKDSKVIVAINKDADAPIFQLADYSLVGDLFTVVPEMIEKI
ncbi:hypothetical protein BB560_003353 [Smittium megazygosporum]|uniref:Probable electron transfer flavoprotein subunit alpha n=1 Tax=Smittium megazygosporum TaxID=133381 RepID=A0A2T9ZC71_9FUNG|nr:hypothetical protein BB560_003353 [Smittium megazygosporum]